jgi:hypothetical protein
MATTIIRDGTLYGPITITNDPATTAGFSLTTAAGAMLMVDSVSGGGGVTISFYAKADPKFSESYLLVDSSNAAVTQTVQAGRCFELPSGMFAARFILPVTDSGTAVIRYAVKG